jgi:hypothetical protein
MEAEILTFDASRRRINRTGATGAAGEILLFSGVRYERDKEPSGHERSASEPDGTSPGADNQPATHV